MTTDFALWQWSLLTQCASGALIAWFFVVFGRGFRTPEVAAWKRAWIANLIALLVTLTDVYLVEGNSGPALQAIVGAYVAARLLFLLSMVEGVLLAAAPSRQLWTPQMRNALAVLAFMAAWLTIDGFTVLGLVSQAMVAVCFFAGGVIALRHAPQPVAWLAIGLLLRSLLGILEVIGYTSQFAPTLLQLPWSSALTSSLLAVSSFFDTIAEWLLAFGCVLAATAKSRRELALTNDELLAAQAKLREMVDIDPLTGLAIRRALAAILRDVQPIGAAIAFVDLRDFKGINDRHGHAVGDDVLRSFADALRHSFRPEDAVVRYAGDEFLVIARGADEASVAARLEDLRQTLSVRSGSTKIQFDAGLSLLDAGGVPDDAIRAADAAMYDAKQRKKRAVSLPAE
jgi:diguanylate cyclase (GGDEF)-like protein